MPELADFTLAASSGSGTAPTLSASGTLPLLLRFSRSSIVSCETGSIGCSTTLRRSRGAMRSITLTARRWASEPQRQDGTEFSMSCGGRIQSSSSRTVGTVVDRSISR